MDKYEYKVREEEIKSLIAQRRFTEAVKIAETIDWTRVRSVLMLCTVSDLFKYNKRYEESKELLLLAYERHPGSRTIVYSLCELSIKMGEVVQAIEYYKEFVQAAPTDNGRFILQYKLYQAQEVSLEERIAVLEEYEKHEYKEKWMYELAFLYHRVGLATKCVEECDQLILWFGEGSYVYKAMELKMLHAPLTAEQQAKYDAFRNPLGLQPGEEPLVYGEEVSQADGDSKEQPAEGVYGQSDAEGHQGALREQRDALALGSVREESSLDREQAAILQGDTVQLPDEELDKIQVKPMDMSKYNTINLQQELAANLHELLSAETAEQEKQADESVKLPETPQKQEPGLTKLENTAEMQEIFFEEESEKIEKVSEVRPAEPEGSKEPIPQPADQTVGFTNQPVRPEMPETVRTGQLTLADMPSMGGVQMPAAQDLAKVQVPEKIAPYLSQEYDGQISLVVPEKEKVEKQITGQMNIQDVLAEWERLKKENERKRMEAVRQRVLEQTGAMFTEFEASVRDGILEQLEKESREGGKRSGRKRTREERQAAVPAAVQKAEAVKEAEKKRAELEKAAAEAAEELQDDAVEELEEIAEVTSEEEVGLAEAADTVTEAVEEEPAAEDHDSDEEAASEETEEAEAGEDLQEEEAGEEDSEEEEAAEAEEEPEEAEEAGEIREKAAEEDKEAEAAEEGDQDTEEEKPAQRRRKTAVTDRELTREEKKLFGSYVTTRESRLRLLEVLENMSLASYTGNVMITGEVGSGTLKLAKALIRDLQMTDRNFSGRVAKVSGIAMNHQDCPKAISRLSNGALVIEGAGKMRREAVENLLKALDHEDAGILVILEDTRRGMDKLQEICPELTEFFTARFDIEQLTNSTLVMYGRKYAASREYAIDEMGVLELYTRIENMQTADHAVTPAEVLEIVDDAIDRANKKTVGHFFDILLGKRYDEDDMIILHEKDFM